MPILASLRTLALSARSWLSFSATRNSDRRDQGAIGLRVSSEIPKSLREDLSIQADEYRQLDDARVLVLSRRSGRGKMSGLDVAQMGQKGAHLFHIRDGKVVTLVVYLDSKRALADLGLSE